MLCHATRETLSVNLNVLKNNLIFLRYYDKDGLQQAGNPPCPDGPEF